MTKEFPNEGDVKKGVKKLLTQHGWWYFMPAANTFGINGASDIIALRKGVMLCIETKLKKGTGSVLQERFGAQVVENGGLYMVVNMTRLESGEFAEWLAERSV